MADVRADEVTVDDELEEPERNQSDEDSEAKPNDTRQAPGPEEQKRQGHGDGHHIQLRSHPYAQADCHPS
jgi:hypothetical protein